MNNFQKTTSVEVLETTLDVNHRTSEEMNSISKADSKQLDFEANFSGTFQLLVGWIE